MEALTLKVPNFLYIGQIYPTWAPAGLIYATMMNKRKVIACCKCVALLHYFTQPIPFFITFEYFVLFRYPCGSLHTIKQSTGKIDMALWRSSETVCDGRIHLGMTLTFGLHIQPKKPQGLCGLLTKLQFIGHLLERQQQSPFPKTVTDLGVTQPNLMPISNRIVQTQKKKKKKKKSHKS